MQLRLDEVRRLTGPNLLSNYPGAIADVLIEGIDSMLVLECWRKHLAVYQQALGWHEQNFYRLYTGGLSLSVSAPMDLLYSTCDLLELAWDACVEELVNYKRFDESETLPALILSAKEEANPSLIALMQKASRLGVTCLADDDEVSLGTGKHSQTWAIDQLPHTSELDWAQYKTIPLALITGTNGKSTSVRLAAEIAKCAGIEAGVTSTDFIKVGNTIIDSGDYSGPGGARMLLRDHRTEMAFLEVARGGLLRRGLPVNKANVSLVTNVASDHLGQYGINTVDEIAQVKLMVAKAIKADGQLVLNADDTRLVKFVSQLFPSQTDIPICWFSIDHLHPLIQQQKLQQLPCVYVEDGNLVYCVNEAVVLSRIVDIPLTVNGTAIHNVQNSLGVVGMCKALGISDTAITAGLHKFAQNSEDNPGRGNLYNINNRQLIVDFAHNAHSMQAVMQMASNMAAKLDSSARTHVMFSHGGDRSNCEIKALTNEVYKFKPNTYILCELEAYLRGRSLGEITNIVKRHLLGKGIENSSIVAVNNPLEGVQKAVELSNSGDLILLFVLSHRPQVQAYLRSLK